FRESPLPWLGPPAAIIAKLVRSPWSAFPAPPPYPPPSRGEGRVGGPGARHRHDGHTLHVHPAARRPVALGAGGRSDRREDPLVRPPVRLLARQLRRGGEATACPERHPCPGGRVYPGRHLVQRARPHLPGALPIVGVGPGSAVHRLAVLFPRRIGESFPLLL